MEIPEREIDAFADRIERLLSEQQARVDRANDESIRNLAQAAAWRARAQALALAVLEVE